MTPTKSIKDTRNIAILAHVDAGKTTVSERLLYFSDVIPGMGEVDEGLATMDYLEEERKRGITIEAGIAAYTWKNSVVTFVDTPGHVDFGVEVDFALQAVEGVVLVLSGVSGIESQSLEAWQKIRSNKNRAMIFINKLDLSSSHYQNVLDQIQLLFNVKPFALTLPIYLDGKIDGVLDIINQLALYRSVENPRKIIKGSIPTFLEKEYKEARKALIDVASQFNDEVMNAYLAGEEIASEALWAGIRAAMLAEQHIPVYMGSALKNVGIRQLMNGIKFSIDAPTTNLELQACGGLVIKIRYYRDLGKIFLVKLYNPLETLMLPDAKYYRVFAESLEEIQHAPAGDIIALQTPKNYRVGEFLLTSNESHPSATKKYRPLLQARIELMQAEDYDHVQEVLKHLADAEPSIQIAPDLETGGWLIRTVGELQLEVFGQKLKRDHACNIRIGTPTVQYLEKIKAPLLDVSNETTSTQGQVNLKFAIMPHVENDQNILHCDLSLENSYREVLVATFEMFCNLGRCGYGPIAGLKCEIQELTSTIKPIPLPQLAKCFADALELNLNCAHFDKYEPLMNLEIIVPDEFCGAVLADLAARGSNVRKLDSDGYNSIILLEIPLANTFGYTTLLRSLSKGLGVYVLTYEKHGLRKKSKP